MAKKKATKKTQKPATGERKPRKSNLYELSAKDFPEVSGQGLLIKTALAKLGPATVRTLADAVAAKLETKQDAAKVVAHYIGAWKAEKLVKVAAAA
jgi:hypothetical protein